MRLKTVILDDEFLALQLLEVYAGRVQDIHFVRSFSKSKEAFEYLKEHEIDLLITDIQMPQINGIDLVSNLNPSPFVIFTTANPQYAIQAFELCVIDYLVKPISFERFESAVAKAVNQYQLVKNNSSAVEGPYIVVKAGYKDIKLFYHEIIYMEGWGEYIKIYTDSDMIITLNSLKKMEELLPADLFRRIHKSYMVSLKKIKSHSLSEVVMTNKAVIPVGKIFRTEFGF